MVINSTAISGRPASLRQAHRSIALRELLNSGGISRTALTKELGLSQMATTRIIRDLIDAGLVREAGEANRDKGPGRKQTLLKLREDGLYTAGIVLTAYATEVSVISLTSDVVKAQKVSVSQISDAQNTIKELAQALLDLIAELGLSISRISGVSLAVAANIEPGTGIIFAENYLGWESTDLKTPFEGLLGLPVIVENIVCARAQAETLIGAAKGHNDVVVLNIATTIGAAIIQEGRLVRGMKFRAGRVGHFKSGDTNLTCSCGRKNCLNCSVTGWSLLNQLKLIDDKIYNPSNIPRYAQLVEGLLDKMQQSGRDKSNYDIIVKEAGGLLGEAIRLVDQLIEPESILLTGSVTRIPEYFEGLCSIFDLSNHEDREIQNKIKLGSVSAAHASAIPALVSLVFSPDLDFENLCKSSTFDRSHGMESTVA